MRARRRHSSRAALNGKGVVEAARAYVARNWWPVPCGRRSKKPRRKGWPELRIGQDEIQDHFRERDNIAVLLGVGPNVLNDVDIDCEEARRLAPRILPKTNCIYGRKSSPRSHYLYGVSSTKSRTRKLVDPTDGKVLVELRGKGALSMVPPSTHPSGESYEWFREGEPAEVKPRVLRSAVPKLGAAALLARHWPPGGERHDHAIALAGLLLDGGMSEEDAAHLVRLVAKVGGDDEVADRVKAVESTAERIRAGERVKGRRALEETLDPKAIDKLESWLDLDAGGDLFDLAKGATSQEIQSALRTWSRNLKCDDNLDRMAAREDAMKHLKKIGVSAAAKLVDAALDAAAPEDEASDDAGQGSALTWPDEEPAPEPADGRRLLDDLMTLFTRHAVLPEGGAVALALWTLYTFAFSSFHIAPYIALLSPLLRCGKSTVLRLLAAVVRRPLSADNLTAATAFRVIEAYRPTLLLDEADAWLSDHAENLRGVLNSGADRDGVVLRCVPIGDDYEVRSFSTWSPKVIAAIGGLPSTIQDRAVVLLMRRKTPDEQVESIRRAALAAEGTRLRPRMARWALDHAEVLESAEPEIPDSLDDRQADVWGVLLAIADAVGGDWPARARQAALTLSSRNTGDPEAGVLLLEDLRHLFAIQKKNRISFDAILTHLEGLPDRPWGDWRRGQPMISQSLMRVLKPFEIGMAARWKGKSVSGKDRSIRGLSRAQLEDAFLRYLPTQEGANSGGPTN